MKKARPKKVRSQDVSQAFRPRARVLQLLGDELIGSARLAVFELVKNAYDADANKVVVRIDLSDAKSPSITVQDDGEGMDLQTLREVWLVPGNDHRQVQRKELKRSKKHKRLPLGEKGLGRFAVHKLGNKITMVTRAKGEMENVVDIDWNQLIAKPFLDQAPVRIKRRDPEIFKRNKTGTRIFISELRSDWSRGEIRRLFAQVTSMCSPFGDTTDFIAELDIPGHEAWVADLPNVKEILDRSIWKFSFKLDAGRITWNYSFRSIPGLKIQGRELEQSAVLEVPPSELNDDDLSEKKIVADGAMMKGIGPISGEFYVYDRDRAVLKRLANIKLLTDYLDENGGVRVYRDGIRVYNYGEPGDDWLGMDLRRVNQPTKGISKNIILGAIHLSLEKSSALVEKTNREGFVENFATKALRRIVIGILGTLEAERQIDKERIRTLTATPHEQELDKISKPISALRNALDKQGVRKTFEPYVAKIEHDYREMQETLLSAGMSGLNLAVVFHEVERGVRALHQVITEGSDPSAAAGQASELMHLLDGFSTLLKRDSRQAHGARKLIDAARRFNNLRLRHHRVRLTSHITGSEHADFESKFSFGLVLGALNNIIDNSLYWMRYRWPDLPPDPVASPRQIYIDISHDFEAGPAIVIADTGPGFQDDPERMARPFFTRKPTGMGLGLYYANLAMELNGGQLVFPQRDEVDIPAEFDGAVIALIFKAGK